MITKTNAIETTDSTHHNHLKGIGPMTLTLNTWVVSPKLIANGRGAWEGTLADLIDSEVDSWCSLAQEMIETGRIAAEDWYNEDFNLADYVDRFILDDVRILADDPNAMVYDAENGSHR